MKLVGVVSAAVLSLALGVAVPAYTQDREQQDDSKAKPAQEEKKAQPEKSAKPEEKKAQEDKSARPEEKNAQEDKNMKPAEKNAPQEQRAAGNRSQIPADKYKANFGQGHTFRVSQSDYNNHRFQYGGYSFGFVGVWPGNWLYTQNVYVIDIDGVYYLCNPMYPGVNLELSFAL